MGAIEKENCTGTEKAALFSHLSIRGQDVSVPDTDTWEQTSTGASVFFSFFFSLSRARLCLNKTSGGPSWYCGV